MPVLADNDVVVHGDAKRRRDIDGRLGHLDVGLRGRRIAGGMIWTNLRVLLVRCNQISSRSSRASWWL